MSQVQRQSSGFTTLSTYRIYSHYVIKKTKSQIHVVKNSLVNTEYDFKKQQQQKNVVMYLSDLSYLQFHLNSHEEIFAGMRGFHSAADCISIHLQENVGVC